MFGRLLLVTGGARHNDCDNVDVYIVLLSALYYIWKVLGTVMTRVWLIDAVACQIGVHTYS